MDGITVDTFFNGRIQVRQRGQGYRFSVDAVLLADHVRPKPGETVLELGTGCGIIALILAYRYPGIKISAVEVQKDMASLAVRNVAENHFSDRVSVCYQDMKNLPDANIPGPVDWVISNPPYRKARSGRVNPDPQRAIARHEIMVNLADVVAVSRRMLKTGGRLVTVYPAERLVDVLVEMRAAGIEPKKLRMIHSQANARAKRVLVQGALGMRSGLIVGPPLNIYEKDGGYTQETAAMFAP